MKPLILASTSAIRAHVLRQAGVSFEAMPPGVDEETLKRTLRAQGASAHAQTMALSEAKAVSVSRLWPNHLVLGCDQMLLCGETVFDKPRDRQEAAHHLKALSGKSHSLLTGAALAENGVVTWRELSEPTLTMHALSEEEIHAYLDRVGEAAFTSVGAYQVESLGVNLFSRIEGEWFSILGLPLLPLLGELRQIPREMP